MVKLISRIGTDAFSGQFSGAPGALAYLEAHFRDTGDGLQARLLDAVDESDFSLRSWIEALMVLSQWLDVRGLSLPMEDKIGYVCCAAEAAGAGSGLTHLPGLVEEMLEAYGCELAEKTDR